MDKLVADDKGLTLVCAWGLPTLGHEEDAERAVRAALAMYEEGEHALAIGVATGRVYCGPVGAGDRSDYTEMGRSVNRAARLASLAAPSGLLCDADTHAEVGDAVEWQDAGVHELKGEAGPAPLWRPSRVRARAPATRPLAARLAGRDVERRKLFDALDALGGGGGARAMLIEGEAGYGKSCVLAELVAEAARRGVDVVGGRADRLDQDRPYASLALVVRGLLCLGADAGPDAAAEAVNRATEGSPELAELSSLLNPLLGTTLPETERVAGFEPEGRSDHLNELIASLVRRAAPLVVTLDDLHWFDSPSLGLARVLARVDADVLVVATARPEGEDRVLLAGAQKLTLGPLQASSLEEVVSTALGGVALTPELRELVVTKSGGSPLFAEQLALALQMAGRLERAGGLARLRKDVSVMDPVALRGVEGLVRARVDGLTAEGQLLLKVASVFGRRIDGQVLRAVYPGASESLDDELRGLVDAGFLVRERRGRWAFRHALVNEAVYESLLFAQRRELHGAICDQLVRRIGTPPATVAFHARHARDWERALRYLELAAASALDSWANAECAKQLERALRIVAEHEVEVSEGRRLAWHRDLAEAYFRLARHDDFMTHAEPALRILGHPLPGSTASTSMVMMGHLLRRGVAKRPRTAPPGDEDTRDRRRQVLDLLNRAMDVYGYQLDVPGLLACAFRTADIAEASQLPGREARGRLMLWFVAWVTPMRGLVRGWVDRCERLVAELDDPAMRAFVLTRIAAARVYEARWDDADRTWREARELVIRLGDLRQLGETDAVGMWSHAFRGQIGRARDLANDRAEDVKITGHAPHEVWCRAQLAWCDLRQEEPGRARERLAETAASLDTLEPATAVMVEGVTAEIALALGQREEAVRLARATLDRAESQPILVYWMYQGIYGAAAALVTVAPATKDAARGVKALGKFAKLFPFAAPAHALWRAILERARRDSGDEALEAALRGAQAAGAGWVEVCALRELGRTSEAAARLEELSTRLRDVAAAA